MAIGYLLRRNVPFSKRDPDQEKLYWKHHQGMAVLSSVVNDADIVTDWLYFIVNATNSTVQISNWLLWLQLATCITGTLSWLIIASDGRLLDWICRAAKWPALILAYIIFYAVMFIVGFILFIPIFIMATTGCCSRVYDTLGDFFSWFDVDERIARIRSYFEEGFQFSRGRLLFLSIFLEDVPQVFVTFMIEDVLKEGGTFGDISNAAQLNLLVAAFGIVQKIAESYWDSRYDIGKTGDDALRTLRSHTAEVESLLAMGGTKFVSSSYDGTIKLWDAATGKLIRTYEYIGHDCLMAKIDETRILVTSNDTTSRDTLCRVYDVDSESTNATGAESGHCVKEIEHPSLVDCVAVSPNGKYYLTGCYDIIVRKWNSAPPYEQLGEYKGVQSRIIACLDDERFLSSNDNESSAYVGEDVGEVNLYHMTTKNTAVLSCQYQAGSQVKCITPMNPHIFLVGLKDHNVQLWNSESNFCVKTFQGHTDEVNSIAKVDDSHFISGSIDRTAKMWNLRSDGCLRTFKGHTHSVMAFAYIKEGSMMISGSMDQTIKVWSLGSVLNSDGEGGAQHGGVDEENIDGGNAADDGDSDGAYDPPAIKNDKRGEEKTKFEETEDLAGSVDQTITAWLLGSITDSNGEGGAQHGGVDEENIDNGGGSDADTHDSDRASAPPVDEIDRRGVEEPKCEEVEDFARRQGNIDRGNAADAHVSGWTSDPPMWDRNRKPEEIAGLASCLTPLGDEWRDKEDFLPV